MTIDALFLLGVLLAPLALVSFVKAWADSRRPYVGAVFGIVAVVLIWLANSAHPDGGYVWRDIPELAAELLAEMLH
jgi:hypothetical protein